MYNSWDINATCQCQQMARSSADQNQKPHWTPFREFPRLFRKFPCLFREFPLLFLARLCSKNGIHPSTRLQSHATGCFNHPTNSRWVQTTMPHYKILWWDASWSSDTCGNSGANDSFPLSLIYSLASWRPKRPNKQTMSSVLKIWKCSKNGFVSENVSINEFVRKNTVFQTHTKIICILMAA